MNKKRSIILSIATVAVLFTGCGGGGSGGSSLDNSISTKSVSGNVIDPAVEGARVYIQCGSTRYYASLRTDENGAFKINGIPTSTNLEDCSVISEGGNDGDDLTGLTLKAPYKLYGTSDGINVTPFTTVLSSHNSLSSDINASKTAVASFLGVQAADLMKDPTSNVNLAKVAKRMTKIALAKNKNGEKIGYLDIDDNITQSDLDSYVEVDLDSVLSSDDKAQLKAEMKAVNDASSVEDIIRQGFVGNTLHQLKKAFRKKTYTADEEKNLAFLAQKIVEANKKTNSETNKTSYKRITRYHLRKALTDIGLVPTFENNQTLSSSINTTLSLPLDNNTSDDFQSFVEDNKTISISDVDGLVLFNTDNYEKLLGNNNDERRNYYAYSNKSNIAKAITLSRNNFSGTVNDSVNSEVANALARLGFYNEAITHIDNNVYGSSELQKAYRELGRLLLKLNQKTLASDSFYKEFDILKKDIEQGGRDNFKSKDKNNLIAIARYFGNASDQKRSNEVITYLESLSSSLNTSSKYSAIPQAFEDLSENVYLEENDLASAKAFAKKGAEVVIKIPTDRQSTAIFNLYRTALNNVIFGENNSSAEVVARAKEVDPDGKYTGFKKAYEYFPIAVDAFTQDDINVTISSIDNASSSIDKKNALNYGAAAVLFLKGGSDELFNKYYKDNSIFKKETDITDHVALGARITLPNALIIKVLGNDAQLEDYLDKMLSFSNDLNITSDSRSVGVYATWSETLSSNRKGHLAIASMYKDLGKEDKAKDVIKNSLTKVISLKDSSQKIKGLINLLTATKALGYEDSNQTNTILSELNTVASLESYDEVSDIINIVNIVSANGKKDMAMSLTQKADKLVVELSDGDLEKVKDRVKNLVGEHSSSNENFVYSVANGYFQSGDLNKTRTKITDALAAINTLEESVDKYKYLTNVAIAYGYINDLDSARNILNQIKTKKELNDAIIQTAKALAEYDAFVGSDIATVDSDLDGKPDFFDVGATSTEINASNLELDDDIDADGLSEFTDKLPYDKI